MPKKSGKIDRRLTYDVIRMSPDNLKPLALTSAERRDVMMSFRPHKPSENFFSNYERAVRVFIWDVEEISKATPARVSARINGIHKNARQLLSDLLSLEILDQTLIDRHFTSQFLQNRKCVSVNEFISYLELFIESTAEAVGALEGVQKGGRMPAYAEQCLAMRIGQAIQDETGELPALTRNGIFSHVLKCALSVGDIRIGRRFGKDRMDVMDLMSHARKTMNSE